MISLAPNQPLAYDLRMAKTTAIGFGDLFNSRRTYRRYLAAFLRLHHAIVRPLGAGCGGSTYGYAGSLEHQFANPALCPPTPFGDGERVHQLVLGANTMASPTVPARSEQKSLFLLASKAARKAARHWWLGRPTQTIVAWRDTACNQHCEGLPNPTERSQAFNDAFALELGNLIIGGGHD